MTPTTTHPPTQTSGLKPGPVCSVCPLYAGCTAICEPVESLLPSMERGRVDHEDLPRLYMGLHLTNALLDHAGILTERQQEVIRLYYRESLLQREIAEQLGISQQAVHDSLTRARMTIGETAKLRTDLGPTLPAGNLAELSPDVPPESRD